MLYTSRGTSIIHNRSLNTQRVTQTRAIVILPGRQSLRHRVVLADITPIKHFCTAIVRCPCCYTLVTKWRACIVFTTGRTYDVRTSRMSHDVRNDTRRTSHDVRTSYTPCAAKLLHYYFREGFPCLFVCFLYMISMRERGTCLFCCRCYFLWKVFSFYLMPL